MRRTPASSFARVSCRRWARTDTGVVTRARTVTDCTCTLSPLTHTGAPSSFAVRRMPIADALSAGLEAGEHRHVIRELYTCVSCIYACAIHTYTVLHVLYIVLWSLGLPLAADTSVREQTCSRWDVRGIANRSPVTSARTSCTLHSPPRRRLFGRHPGAVLCCLG